MTSFELGNLIKDRLGAAGLSQYLDEAKEQYLEFPDGFFAEVVLKDGSKLSEAQRLVKSIEEELRKQGVELSTIVRATWEIARIDNEGAASSVRAARGKGVQIAAPDMLWHSFIVTLQSGNRQCTVKVHLTATASAVISRAFDEGGLREFGSDKDSALLGIVREFVRLELSYGGESYWDPTLNSELTLNEDALSYLTMEKVSGRL